MTNEQILAGLVGIAITFVISYLKNCTWSTKWKFVLAAVCSIIAGAIVSAASTSYVAGGFKFNPATVLQDILIVFTAAQGFYKIILEGTEIEKRLAG